MGGFSYGDSSYDSATKINSNSIQVSDKVYSNSAPYEYHHRKDNEQDWDYVDFDDMEGRNTQTKLDEMLKSSMSGLMDFNNDGKLDSKDVDLFNAKLSSNSLDSTFTYSKDLNGDGKVDSLDVNILDNYINGEDISQFVDISNLNYINNLLQSDYAKEHPNSISELLNTNGYDNISDEANLKVYADRYMKSVADFNGDGKIDKNDISYLTDHLGSNSSDYSFNSKADFNGDGIFDEKDIDIYKKYQAGEDVSKLIGNNQVLADAYKDDLMDYQRKRDQYIKYKEYLEAHDGSKDDIKELEKKIADLNNQMRNVKRNYQALGRNTDSTYVKPTDKSSTYWDDKIDYDKIYQCYVDGQGFTNYENWIKDEYKDAVKDEYGGLSSYPFDFLSVIEYLADEKGLDDDALDDIARMGWSDTVNEYRNYTKEQKASYHKAMREGGRDAAEDYYNSEYDEMWGRKDYYEFLSNKYGKDYADMVFSNDDIVLYFKMESQKDYTCTINKKSESDYIKDFLKSTNNQSLLDRYLKGEDIMSEIDSYKYLDYKYNEQLKEYEDKRAALQFKMEELKELYKYLPDDERNESGDINDIHMSKQEVDGMLDELSEEIAKYNQLIKSQKSTVEQLPYMNIMCTDEYQDYVKNFDPAWQDEVDYEKLYNQMKNSKNVNGDSLNWAKEEYVEAARNNGSTIDLANTQVDWIAVVEYMINVKGYNFDENDNGWTGISDSYTYYKHMTSEQLYMYHYLFKTKGYDAAKEYLDVIADDINKAKGKEEALEWIQSLNPSYEYDENGNIIAIHVDDNAMNTIRQFLGGVETGMTDYYSGMLKWGQDGYTVDEYKQMYVMKILGDSDLLVGAFNAGRVTGSIETAAAITSFCTIVCPEGVGGHVALAFNNIVGVANAGGNAQHSVLVEGYSEATANEYAKQIMQNTLLTNLSSSAIGYGIGSTLQYSSLLNGTNNLGFLNNLAISGANGIVGAGTAVWSKAEEQKLQESLLSKRFEVDDKNGELLQSFMDSMLMTALSTGKTMAFELVLGGESLHFSTDDWIDYLKSDDSPTAEDFVRNAYSGSKALNTSTGESYTVPKGMTSNEYLNEAKRILSNYRGVIGDGRDLPDVEKNNLKYIINQLSDEDFASFNSGLNDREFNFVMNNLPDNFTSDSNYFNRIGSIFQDRMRKSDGTIDMTPLNKLNINDKNNILSYVMSNMSADDGRQFLIDLGKQYGIDETHMFSYLKGLSSDADWGAAGISGLMDDKITKYLFKNDMEDNNTNRQKAYMALVEEKITSEQISNYKKEHPNVKLTDGEIRELLANDLIESNNQSQLSFALITIEEYNRRYQEGYFADGYDINDVFYEKVMCLNDKDYVPETKNFGKNGEYNKYFPTTDYFISDQAVIDYMKNTVSCDDSNLLNQFQQLSSIEEMGKFLQSHENSFYVESYTFQNASDGANNFVKFNAVGATWNMRRGGLYSLLKSDFEKGTSTYPDVYGFDADGNIKIYDMEAFGRDVLSGVPLNNIDGAFMIKVKAPLGSNTSSSMSIPSVSNGSAYAANFISGGELGSQNHEIVIAGVKVNAIEVGYHIRKEGQYVITGNDGVEYVITQINQSNK